MQTAMIMAHIIIMNHVLQCSSYKNSHDQYICRELKITIAVYRSIIIRIATFKTTKIVMISMQRIKLL